MFSYYYCFGINIWKKAVDAKNFKNLFFAILRTFGQFGKTGLCGALWGETYDIFFLIWWIYGYSVLVWKMWDIFFLTRMDIWI